MNSLIAKLKALIAKLTGKSAAPAAAKCACGNTKDVNGNCDGSHATQTNTTAPTPPSAAS